MKRGDFLFWYPVNKIDHFICQYSGKYSHCGLYLGGDLIISARMKKGIDFDLLSEYGNHFDVFSIVSVSETGIDKMVEFALSLRGKKYDRWQLPFVVFKKRPFSSANRYFCSEYLSVASIRIGRIPLQHPENISPTDLANENWLIQNK